MACRVGITTDPQRRKQEWEEEYPWLRRWTIISRHSTRSAAQTKENQEARNRGCEAHPGGAGPERATWYVYYFEY